MKKMILWSHPRSRSTAFERAFIEREDCYVLHEPLSMAKYKGVGENEIIEAISKLPKSAENTVLTNVTHKGRNAEHVFIKDFPYHSEAAVERMLKSDFIHTFLIRHPSETILSWQRIHPVFEEFELGYRELRETVRSVKKGGGRILLVNASDLVAKPADVLREYCKYVGIEFMNNMCNWSRRDDIAAWDIWKRYHTTAQRSRGFSDHRVQGEKLSRRSIEFYARAISIYQQILKESE